MAKTFNLEIITPEMLFYRGEVQMVTVETTDGKEGFMAGHSWACKLLAPGEVRIKEDEKSDFKIGKLSGGYIDVKEKTVIFADTAEWKED